MDSTVDYSNELDFAKRLAERAGTVAMEYYRAPGLTFVAKADGSPVTPADEAVNALVIAAVKEQYPDYGVIGEEESWQTERKQLWVCDPIDGTIDYIMHVPTFMFSIALVEDGRPVVAVTYAPATGDVYYAVKGQGAFTNDNRQLKVSERTLREAWIANPTNIQVSSSGLYHDLRENVAQMTAVHGGVFKGMLVAQGTSDGSLWPYSVSPWDMAAVALIVSEAGGIVCDFHGNEHRYDQTLTGGLIVSNSAAHNDLLALASKYVA